MTGQLAFDLPFRPASGREAFFVAPSNSRALEAVEQWQDWPGGRLVLAGPAGSGKSHLVQVFAEAAKATVISATNLAQADLPRMATGATAVEDADLISADASAETALLHLLNMAGESGGRLLVTGKGAPAGWGTRLPDLASRLIAAPLAVLDPPCDRLLAAVLVKLFTDRQVNVAPQVVAFLVSRMERSLESAAALVARLDAEALARRQAVTRTLAAGILAENGPWNAHRQGFLPLP